MLSLITKIKLEQMAYNAMFATALPLPPNSVDSSLRRQSSSPAHRHCIPTAPLDPDNPPCTTAAPSLQLLIFNRAQSLSVK
jgi:hypothetical protein